MSRLTFMYIHRSFENDLDVKKKEKAMFENKFFLKNTRFFASSSTYSHKTH